MNWKLMARNPYTSMGGLLGLLSQLPDMWGTAINQGMTLPKMPGLLFIFCHNFALPLSLIMIGLGAKDASHAEPSAPIGQLPPSQPVVLPENTTPQP